MTFSNLFTPDSMNSMCSQLVRWVVVIFFGGFPLLPLAQVHSLLTDPDFSAGYEVMDPEKDIYTERSERQAVHRRPGASGEPAWRLVQWGSSLSLADAKPRKAENSAVLWELAAGDVLYKSVELGADSSVTMMLNGLAEFSSDFYLDAVEQPSSSDPHYIENLDEHWPHLLLAQNIQSDKLLRYDSLVLSFDARLLYDQKNIHNGYKESLHVARFPIAIAVRNTLSNNTFWLMLPVYDGRYTKSNFICQKCVVDDEGNEQCNTPESLDSPGRWKCPYDGNRWNNEAKKKGTRKMIFRVPTVAMTQGNIHQGQWTRHELDLLPYIRAGIQAARDASTLGGFSSNLRFYDLVFFSMGWEITGLNRAALSVKDLQLEGVIGE